MTSPRGSESHGKIITSNPELLQMLNERTQSNMSKKQTAKVYVEEPEDDEDKYRFVSSRIEDDDDDDDDVPSTYRSDTSSNMGPARPETYTLPSESQAKQSSKQYIMKNKSNAANEDLKREKKYQEDLKIRVDNNSIRNQHIVDKVTPTKSVDIRDSLEEETPRESDEETPRDSLEEYAPPTYRDSLEIKVKQQAAGEPRSEPFSKYNSWNQNDDRDNNRYHDSNKTIPTNNHQYAEDANRTYSRENSPIEQAQRSNSPKRGNVPQKDIQYDENYNDKNDRSTRRQSTREETHTPQKKNYKIDSQAQRRTIRNESPGMKREETPPMRYKEEITPIHAKHINYRDVSPSPPRRKQTPPKMNYRDNPPKRHSLASTPPKRSNRGDSPQRRRDERYRSPHPPERSRKEYDQVKNYANQKHSPQKEFDDNHQRRSHSPRNERLRRSPSPKNEKRRRSPSPRNERRRRSHSPRNESQKRSPSPRNERRRISPVPRSKYNDARRTPPKYRQSSPQQYEQSNRRNYEEYDDSDNEDYNEIDDIRDSDYDRGNYTHSHKDDHYERDYPEEHRQRSRRYSADSLEEDVHEHSQHIEDSHHVEDKHGYNTHEPSPSYKKQHYNSQRHREQYDSDKENSRNENDNDQNEVYQEEPIEQNDDIDQEEKWRRASASMQSKVQERGKKQRLAKTVKPEKHSKDYIKENRSTYGKKPPSGGSYSRQLQKKKRENEIMEKHSHRKQVTPSAASSMKSAYSDGYISRRISVDEPIKEAFEKPTSAEDTWKNRSQKLSAHKQKKMQGYSGAMKRHQSDGSINKPPHRVKPIEHHSPLQSQSDPVYSQGHEAAFQQPSTHHMYTEDGQKVSVDINLRLSSPIAGKPLGPIPISHRAAPGPSAYQGTPRQQPPMQYDPQGYQHAPDPQEYHPQQEYPDEQYYDQPPQQFHATRPVQQVPRDQRQPAQAYNQSHSAPQYEYQEPYEQPYIQQGQPYQQQGGTYQQGQPHQQQGQPHQQQGQLYHQQQGHLYHQQEQPYIQPTQAPYVDARQSNSYARNQEVYQSKDYVFDDESYPSPREFIQTASVVSPVQQKPYEEPPRLAAHTHPKTKPMMNPYNALPPIDQNQYQGEIDTPQADNGGGYAAQFKQKKDKVPDNYKAYTYKDYQRMKKEVTKPLGGLGPDTDSETLIEKKEKIQKQRQYAKKAHERNMMMRVNQNPMKPRAEDKTETIDEKSLRRKMAMEYARNVPRPQVRPQPNQFNSYEVAAAMDSPKPGAGSDSPVLRAGTYSQNTHGSPRALQRINNPQAEMIDLENLKQRHEREKQNIATIRQNLNGVTS